MQLTEARTKVIQGGLQSVKTFSMKMNAKAFRVIICDIYSDRIRAFVRELGTNAYEAHQVSKIETEPFEVTLPSMLNPNFIIRDFGPGLDQTEIENIYTVVFESTKTNSNELGGCFGLGSKSPFAYTDNFAVTSIKNGKKSFYTIYLNAEGIPELALLHSEDTTERSGLEVKIGIKTTDFDKVASEVANVYSWFATKPTIKNRKVDFNDRKTLVSRADFVLFAKNSGYFHPIVKMGNIVYQIDVSQVKTRLASLPVMIEVPIGSVTPEPSRERLTYTPHTIAVLTAKLKATEEFLKLETQSQIDKCDSFYEACRTYFELSTTVFSISDFTYKGVMLEGNVDLSNKTYLQSFYFQGDKLKKRTAFLSMRDKSYFFLNDVKNSHKEIIKQNRKSLNISDYGNIFIIEGTEQQKFMADSKVPEKLIVKLSSLPYNRVQRAKTARKTKVLEWKYSTHVTYSWDECQATGGYYVDYHNSYIEINGKEIHPRKIHDITSFIDWKDKIYGIRRIDRKRVQNDPNWKPFFPEAESQVKKLVVNFSPEVISASSDLLNSFLSKNTYITKILESKELDYNPEFLELNRIYKLAKDAKATDSKKIRAIEDIFGNVSTVSLLSKTDIDKFYTMISAIEDKLPLLSCIETYVTFKPNQIKEIISYVKKGLK